MLRKLRLTQKNGFFIKKIDKLVKQSKKGYILEANVEYLRELHKKDKKLPFLTENENSKGGKTSTKT